MLPGPVSKATTASGPALSGIAVRFAMPPMFCRTRPRLHRQTTHSRAAAPAARPVRRRPCPRAENSTRRECLAPAHRRQPRRPATCTRNYVLHRAQPRLVIQRLAVAPDRVRLDAVFLDGRSARLRRRPAPAASSAAPIPPSSSNPHSSLPAQRAAAGADREILHAPEV